MAYLRSGQTGWKLRAARSEAAANYWSGRDPSHKDHRKGHVSWAVGKALLDQREAMLVRELSRSRRLQMTVATPRWADAAKIEMVYRGASRLSEAMGVEFQVDHVVPIKSDVVCGLHVPANLQVLAQDENGKKSNKHWPDMP